MPVDCSPTLGRTLFPDHSIVYNEYHTVHGLQCKPRDQQIVASPNKERYLTKSAKHIMIFYVPVLKALRPEQHQAPVAGGTSSFT